MRTSSAADFVPASSPARQIVSANAAIFSSSLLDIFGVQALACLLDFNICKLKLEL